MHTIFALQLLFALDMAKKRKKKTSTLTYILLALGGIAVYLYTQISKISFGSASTSVTKITTTGIELLVSLPVFNETNLTLSINNFLGQVFYNDIQLGPVTQVKKIDIDPLSVGIIQYNVSISFIAAAFAGWNVAQQIQQGKTPDISKLYIKGTLKAEGLNYTLPKTPLLV